METPLLPSDFHVEGVDGIVRRLPTFFTISVASKRNSGKTVLVTELVKQLLREKKVDMCVVMSGSAGLTEDYSFLPKKLVMPFSERLLTNTWRSQEKKKPDDRKHILFVLDDCLATPEAIRNPMLTRIFSLGRHCRQSCILISQHTTVLLSPIMKANSDIILWSKLGRGALEVLWLSSTNISKKDFITVSEALGGINFQFMLLDNYTGSTDPHVFLSVVRAKPPPK